MLQVTNVRYFVNITNNTTKNNSINVNTLGLA